ncbi:MAG: hypothetical protein AAGK78_11320, partial [Planctomycetota bacterium]
MRDTRLQIDTQIVFATNVDVAKLFELRLVGKQAVALSTNPFEVSLHGFETLIEMMAIVDQLLAQHRPFAARFVELALQMLLGFPRPVAKTARFRKL